MNNAPTKDEAQQFGLMIMVGLPHSEALRYFYPDSDEEELTLTLKGWMKSETLKRTLLSLQGGKPWQEMNLDEKISYAITKHYSEMAYFLFSRNYSTLSGIDRQKADTCRVALEAKLAGTSGKLNPLEMFWDDVRTGKIKLQVDKPTPPTARPTPSKVLAN